MTSIKNRPGTAAGTETTSSVGTQSTTSRKSGVWKPPINQLIHDEVSIFFDTRDQSACSPEDVELELLNRINTRLASESVEFGLKGRDAYQQLKALPPAVIAECILTRELKHTGLIGKSRATAELMTYENEEPNKGLYVPAEDHIRSLAFRYNYMISPKDCDDVVKRVRYLAPLLKESEDPDVVALANGLFNVRSRELREFSPEVVLTSKAATDFNGNATTCPVINGWSVDEWIRELANDDTEIEQPVRESIEEQGLRPDKYDVFLCHAWDDRRETAKELHDALVRAGVSVWFSENEVLPGSNLMREIDKGLSKSRAGVVLVTKSFIKRIKAEGVANKELSTLLARDRLVPIVHGVTYDDLREESPLLASRSGFDTADDTMEEIATKISELVSTDAFSD